MVVSPAVLAGSVSGDTMRWVLPQKEKEKKRDEDVVMGEE